MFGYIEQLQEVDTSKVEPVAQVTGLVNVMREDSAKHVMRKRGKELFPTFRKRRWIYKSEAG